MSLNWDPSLAKTRYQVDAATIYQIVWTALLFWDWFITLPLEVRAIWRAKTTVLKVTFLFQRYGTLLFMLIASYLLLHDVPMSESIYLFILLDCNSLTNSSFI